MPRVKGDAKKIIKNTAARLFRERGYAAIGMRELAKEVGMEAPSIYNHYKSKDELLQQFCFEVLAQLNERFANEVDETKSVSKQLRGAIRAHIAVLLNNTEAASVYVYEWIFLEEPRLADFKQQKSNYESQLTNIIARGITKGDFRAVNPKLATMLLLQSLNAMFDLQKAGEQITEEMIVESAADVLLKGLKK